MSSGYITSKLDTDCPICGKVHTIEIKKRHSHAIVKEETVEYEETYYSCPFSDGAENEYVPAAMMDENLLRARDSYRKKRGLLASQEIAAIRSYYGMTQSDFSALLGWGEVTVTRYESKLIQDDTYDMTMRMAYENPFFALSMIEKNRSRFSPGKYEKVRSKIKDRIEESGTEYLKRQAIMSIYSRYDKECDLNGGKRLDLSKVISVIRYFSTFIINLNGAKLMSLLWYSDAMNFSRHGRSMMGLVYMHKRTGALPVGCREILTLDSIGSLAEPLFDEIGYSINPVVSINISDFSLEELGVLEAVASEFKDMEPCDVLQRVISEKAYVGTLLDEAIYYSQIGKLNI
ncbi:type II TA system antitoxin MqsA family protein [Youngiibacter multivorans]|uniref:Zinc finger/helix-turn-helix YgiT family protein n=1 Tax=Youngiibacter multivorans TaxID=937251 RepID=A0ABS4FZZ4_9CLOT|nr:type II TA system antitoxin MqsA family protein [Youngiibacter multivorans]MBP1917865.1 putative zinc finger/helix-turn-helix YgiT family protein [Youngiibacter multivorans]